MSNEETNRKIAEACGWRSCVDGNGDAVWSRYVNVGDERQSYSLPDYCSDLNAMHEAEKSIESLDWHTYTRHLRAIVQRDCNSEIHYVPGCERAQLIADFWFYRASAAQRAEAFLKTVAPKL